MSSLYGIPMNDHNSNPVLCFHEFKVKALAGQRVIQVACGSRDAQTLALTDEGLVYSWGDGDFGKLGRGGSEGCSTPQNVEKLNGVGICQIECGAQFSLALSKNGLVWTWGKGDYFRYDIVSIYLLPGNFSQFLDFPMVKYFNY